MSNSVVNTCYAEMSAEIRAQAEKAVHNGHFVITATQPPRPGCMKEGGFRPYYGPIIIDYINCCLGVRGN